MRRTIRPHLTYANVMSTLAVFLVIGGGAAYAANTIFSSDIVDGEVKGPDLANGAVANAKLAGGAVTSEKVADESLKGRDVLDNTLRGVDIDESTLSSIGGGGPAGGDLTGSYPNPLIRDQSIGARHLKGTVQANDSEQIAAGGVSDDVRAECPPGTYAIGGGGYWEFQSGTLSGLRMLGAAVLVEGTNRGNASQSLLAFAYCLEN